MKTLVSMYHDVYRNSPNESGFAGVGADRYKYNVNDFKNHIDAIANSVVSNPILVTQIDNHRDKTPYMITFDDGGESFYSQIRPILEELKWKAHFFVATNYIGTNGFLTKEQIKELDKQGHVIGVHSASHPPNISSLSFPEIKSEWQRSIDVLSEILGKPITVASVPGGYYSLNVAKAAYECGIKYLMTSEPIRKVNYYKDMLIIGRYTMFNYKTEEFASAIARNQSNILIKEIMYWNTKKIAKKVLGSTYTQLKDFILTKKS